MRTTMLLRQDNVQELFADYFYEHAKQTTASTTQNTSFSLKKKEQSAENTEQEI